MAALVPKRDLEACVPNLSSATCLDLEQWKRWCNVISSNSNVPVSCVKWDDVANALVGLKIYTKYEEYRFHMTENIVRQCKKFIENSNVLNFEKCCSIQANAFRLLRNYCVGLKKNQDYIMSCELPCTAIEILDQILKHDQEDIDRKQVLTSGIQFLGNVVVDHKKNKEIVWKQCYPHLFMKVMRCRYNEAKNYVCMIIYNCIKEKPRTELCTTNEGLSLINDIVEMCCINKINVEWGIFIIESLIQNGSFQQVYTGLKDNVLRLFLLESIEYRLKENHTPKFCVSWVSSNNANFISQTFEDSVKDMNTETNSDVEESSSQIILVSSLLRLLCLLTAFENEYEELRSRKCLLQTTLITLCETSSEENRNFFSNLKRFSNPDDDNDNSTHPAFGFKRSLIQLISNMCYLNTLNQDCVRDMDCIPVLLDHCNIDDYNPYICQWAVFCIRNVLENNLENQQIIRSLTKHGLASNTRLAEAGFVVEETADGKLRVVGIPNKDISS